MGWPAGGIHPNPPGRGPRPCASRSTGEGDLRRQQRRGDTRVWGSRGSMGGPPWKGLKGRAARKKTRGLDHHQKEKDRIMERLMKRRERLESDHASRCDHTIKDPGPSDGDLMVQSNYCFGLMVHYPVKSLSFDSLVQQVYK